MNVAEAIRCARKNLGLTQLALARRATVSTRAIWTLENGGGHLSTLLAVMPVLDFRVTGVAIGLTLGAQVKAKRERKGWSLATLAEAAGLSVPTVASIEQNRGQVKSLEAILRVLAPRARNRRPERSPWAGGQRDVRFTPPDLLDKITSVYGPIDLDPCGNTASPVVAGTRYLEEDDGLSQPWRGFTYVNPPFYSFAAWVAKAREEWHRGEVKTIVALLPARTERRAFHDLVKEADVIFLKGRLRFSNMDGTRKLAPLPCILAIWGGSVDQAAALAEKLPGLLMSRQVRTVG